MDVGLTPQWFPEYGLSLGAPSARLPRQIADLATGSGVYARTYQNGVALANPSDASRVYTFAGTHWLAEPYGGGALPGDADMSGEGVRTRALSGSITLAPHSGAVVLDRPA